MMRLRQLFVWSAAVVMLAGGCAGEGKHAQKEKSCEIWVYKGEAQFLFSPVKVLPGSPAVIVGFGEYVHQQCVIIASRRVIALTLQEPDWRTTGRGDGDAVVDDFNSRFEVKSAGGLVLMTYLDPDPKVALAAIKSVVGAYKKLYAEVDPENTQAILKLLDNDRVKIGERLKELEAKKGTPQTPEEIAKDAAQRLEFTLRLQTIEMQYTEKSNEYALTNRVQFLDSGSLAGRVQAEKQDGNWVVLERVK